MPWATSPAASSYEAAFVKSGLNNAGFTIAKDISLSQKAPMTPVVCCYAGLGSRLQALSQTFHSKKSALTSNYLRICL